MEEFEKEIIKLVKKALMRLNLHKQKLEKDS